MRLIIVGIFFWVLKPRYITSFFLPPDNFLNMFGFEIIGTILVLIGILIIFRVYPFAYSIISSVYILFILLINILDFFLYNNADFKKFQEYSVFFTSIMLIFISKLVQDGLRHFGSSELARKWSGFAIIIFFGISIPSYTYLTLKNLGCISFSFHTITKNMILGFLPVGIVALFCMAYYLIYLAKSLKYLSSIQKKYNEAKKLT